MDKLKDKIVLIVDDEESNRFALSSYLEACSVKVLTVQKSLEAISLLKESLLVDAILLDIMMPVMDGYEMLGRLKQDETLKNIPIIAATAKAMKGDKEKCLAAGASDYISKPIDTK